MRLFNWNINQKNTADPSKLRCVLDAIDNASPDSLSLQEVGDGIYEFLVMELQQRGFATACSDVPKRTGAHRVVAAVRGAAKPLEVWPVVHDTFPRAIVAINMRIGDRPGTLVAFHVPNGSKQGWRKADCLNAIADVAEANDPQTTMLLAGDANEPASYRPNGTVIPYIDSKYSLNFDENGKVVPRDEEWPDKRGESRHEREWYNAIERLFPSAGPRTIAELCLDYHLAPNAEPSHRSTRKTPKPLDHLFAIGPLPSVERLEFLHHLRWTHTKGGPSDHSALVVELG